MWMKQILMQKLIKMFYMLEGFWNEEAGQLIIFKELMQT